LQGAEEDVKLTTIIQSNVARVLIVGALGTVAGVKAEPQAERDPIDKQNAPPKQPTGKLLESAGAENPAARAMSPRQGAATVGATAGATVQQQQPQDKVLTTPGSLLFPSGQSELTPTAKQSLDAVAYVIAQQPSDTKLRVEGYTDTQGGEQLNQRLSEKRAQAVADDLIGRGVQPDRLSVVGRGESDPIGDNDSPAGRASNRRVEIVVGASDGAQR
jgi:outer membrane protein OmpA-like peptidoglycan-associated protein